MTERKAWWAAGTLGALLLAGLVTAGIAVSSRAESDSKDSDKIRKKQTVTVVTPKAERGAFLGVRTSEETKSNEGGALVDEVVDDSPAADAGIREGDVIVSFDGAPVRGPMGLTERIHKASPADKVKVGILRDGKRETVDVTLGERSHTIIVPGPEGMMKVPLPDTEALEEHLKGLENFYVGDGGKAWVFKSWGSRPKLGVQLVETTPELREHLGGGRDRGVLVGKVMGGKPAEKAGVRVGDLLVSVDGSDVSDAGELIEALEDKDGKTVDVELVRDGKTMHLQIALPAAEDDEDETSGPRAEAMQRAREALMAARMAQWDVTREVRQRAREAELEAVRAARGAQREALRESRERQRETMRQLRQELLRARSATLI